MSLRVLRRQFLRVPVSHLPRRLSCRPSHPAVPQVFVTPFQPGIPPRRANAFGAGEATHDVTEEGLHIDVYRDGEKTATHVLTPPLPVAAPLDAAEDHLAEHLEGYVARFETWQRTRRDDR